MKVDRITYVLMSGHGVFKLVKNADGQIYEEVAKLSDLRVGKKVSVMAHANRVTKVLILN